MRRHALAAVLLGAVLAGCATPTVTARTLDPLQPGWERIFRLDWDRQDRQGRPVLAGYLYNDSPYIVQRVQLLVDALDAGGDIVGQRVAWAGPGAMAPFTRAYFSVPAPPGGAQYRVRVFSYERLEAGDSNDFK